MSRKVIQAINERVKSIGSVDMAKGTLKGYIKMYLMATWPNVEKMGDKDFDSLVTDVAGAFYKSDYYSNLLKGLEATVQEVKKSRKDK